MIKNGCKIIRKAGQTQSWPIDSDCHNSNIIAPDIEVPSAAKSSDRHYDL